MELFNSVKEDIASKGWGDVPDLNTLDDTGKKIIELILKRFALAKALQTDEHQSPINREAGYYQDTALRLYLLLTCMEILGRLGSDNLFVDFSSWLITKKSPIKEERDKFVEDLFNKYEVESDSTEYIILIKCI